MSFIRSANLNTNQEIQVRAKQTSSTVRSIHLDQTSGYFVTTEPLNGNGVVIFYPQSPNTTTDSIVTISQIGSYGLLKLPLDARYDFARHKIWIADTGNSRVFKINPNTLAVDAFIPDIIFPHTLSVNYNDDSIFIKAYTDSDTGIIHHYNHAGEEQATFEFDVVYPYDDFDVSSDDFDQDDVLQTLHLPSTMTFDHVRSRLWWVAETKYVYMADIRNQQVFTQNVELTGGYEKAYGVNVDLVSGHAFAVVGDNWDNRWVAQIDRDNIDILGAGFSKKTPEIRTYSSTSVDVMPSLNAHSFDLPEMNGTWQWSGNNYYHSSYDNVADAIPAQEGIFTYGNFVHPTGTSSPVWLFYVAYITSYPTIDEIWYYFYYGDVSDASGYYSLVSYGGPNNIYVNDNGYLESV